MIEYVDVLNDFLLNYGSITDNFVSMFSRVQDRLVPILLFTAACSVLITFYQNIVK